MQTKVKSGVFKPKVYVFSLPPHSDPLSVATALADSNWQQYEEHEFQADVQRKWVFCTKYKADVTLDKYTLLVAKGCQQTSSVGILDTFSPVVKSG